MAETIETSGSMGSGSGPLLEARSWELPREAMLLRRESNVDLPRPLSDGDRGDAIVRDLTELSALCGWRLKL